MKLLKAWVVSHQGWTMLLVLATLCIGGGTVFMSKTATYPSIGNAVSYPVNQLEGFALSIEDPTWSPARGYTIKYSIDIDSMDVYYLETGNNPPNARLEQLVDGTWYALDCDAIPSDFVDTWNLGGSGSRGFASSLVQSYDGYGTRLEPGTYRFLMELTDGAGISHYLAAEFPVT